MAYNNGFPISYQQYYPQYQPQAPMQQMPQIQQMPQMQQQQPQQQQGSRIWVSGEAGAKAYLVAPNTTVDLWDSERQVIYIKSADSSGMPQIKILDYSIRGEEQAKSLESVPQDYVTHDELKDVEDKIIQMIKDRKDYEHKSGSNNRNAASVKN